METLLIVDDERATLEALRMAFDEEFDCYIAKDLAEARQVMRGEQIDLLLTDLRLGGDSGMDVLAEAQSRPVPPVAIMMTAYGSVDTAVEAMKRGAWHFVTKPLNLDEVEMMLKRALRTRRLEQNNERLELENRDLKTKAKARKPALERLIGNSEAMRQIKTKIEHIAPTKATVLILGESGTGKEVAAQALHDLSGRAAGKFVAVNCAALSPQLLESELFGHEKGAFTGASQRRVGRFEQASGGTLFLDEIGEIDQSTQVKLLRALSERTIERVGSNTPIKVDVRVVAATNRDLRRMVAEEDFREDLYYRLNVLSLQMPPLRERQDDVVLLAHAFLSEFAKENGKKVKPLSKEALRVLASYEWPGNVRELRTAIEHGVVMSTAAEIGTGDLPGFLGDGPIRIRDGKDKNDLAPVPEFNLHALERRAVRGALEATQGNRTQAAMLLGISRRTLQRKLTEIDPQK